MTVWHNTTLCGSGRDRILEIVKPTLVCAPHDRFRPLPRP
jgi:hypothetical protein